MDPIEKANELVNYYKGNKNAIMDDIKVTLDHYSKMISKFPTSDPVKDGMRYWMDVKKQVLNY